jgi:hypothetical protein
MGKRQEAIDKREGQEAIGEGQEAVQRRREQIAENE